MIGQKMAINPPRFVTVIESVDGVSSLDAAFLVVSEAQDRCAEIKLRGDVHDAYVCELVGVYGSEGIQ